MLTFDTEICAALVCVGLAGDLAGILELAAIDDELALLAVFDNLYPVIFCTSMFKSSERYRELNLENTQYFL